MAVHHRQGKLEVRLLHLVRARRERLDVGILREGPVGVHVVVPAQVVRLLRAHVAGALQRQDASAGLVQALRRLVLAGDGVVELGVEVEVATVVALLRRRHGHRPHPAAQDERVVQHVRHEAPPREAGLVLVHRRVVLVLVQRPLAVLVIAAPRLLGDAALDVDGQAAALHVDCRVHHVVAVEHHVVHGTDLAVALVGVVHGPTAVVDEARRRRVEPLHVVPALTPDERAMAEVGDLRVVLGDVRQDVDHARGVVRVGVEAVPVVLRVLIGR